MQRYEKYKDSGIEWLGEIPEHWEVKRFQSLFLLGKGLSITKADLKEEGVRCVNYGEIHSKYGFELKPEKHSLKFVDKSYLKTFPNALLKKGDFVFADTSEDMSGSGNFTFLNSDISVFSGYHTVIARPIHKGESKFFAYQFDSNSIRQQIRCKVKGVKVFSITQSLLKEVQLFIPPLHEQKAISKFLDDKCEKIDAAIVLKQQQIEKLKELRQTTIHNAVAKGVVHFKGEVVSAKDSGINWIGEIPEHWEVKRLKNELNYFKGFAFSSTDFSEEGVGIVKASNIKRFSIKNITSFIKLNNQRLEFERFRIAFGDIIISTVGSKPEIIESAVGQLAFVEEEFSNLYLNQNTVCFRLTNPSNSNLFFKYLFQSQYIRDYFNKISLWIANQAYLEIDEILNIPLFLPPLSEQEEIATYLEEQTSKIDKAIAQKQDQIVKLKEYKQSLINEAVTGKIKITA